MFLCHLSLISAYICIISQNDGDPVMVSQLFSAATLLGYRLENDRETDTGFLLVC